MELLSNLTLNSSRNEDCKLKAGYIAGLLLIDIIMVVIGQPVTMRLLWVSSKARKSRDILNCNLALFHNFFYALCVVHLVYLCLRQEYSAKFLHIVYVYAQTGGPMSLSVISMERYVAVIHPTSYPLLKTYRCREVAAAMVWLFSILSTLMTTFLKEDVSHLIEMTLKAIPFAVMSINTTTMTWCSVCIARELRRSGPGRDQLHPVKRKAFITVCATSFINLLCYFPVTVMQKVKFQDEYSYQCRVIPLCVLLLAAASVVHPLFYMSTQERIRRRRGQKTHDG